MASLQIKTVEDIFDRALAIEEKSEDFYRNAATRFEGTDLQMLLYQLAEEEIGHQNDVQRMKEMKIQKAIREKEVDFPVPEFNLQEFDQVAASGDEQAVVDFARRMEKNAAESYRVLAEQCEGELAEIASKLQKMEAEHADKLERMAKDIGLSLEEEGGEFHAH